jgi:signal transduction histidine kinase
VGPYVGMNAILIGFFGFAAIYHVLLWVQSRRDAATLAFAFLCAICAMVSANIIALVTARTPAEGQRALDLRVDLALLSLIPAVWLVSLISGVRARRFVWFVTAASLGIAVVNEALLPLTGIVTGVEQISTSWGEPLSSLHREAGSRWLVAGYALVLTGYLFGMVGAVRLWRHDRVGGGLLALAFAGLMASWVWAAGIDVGGFRGLYVGGLPYAPCVILMAVQIARGYRLREERDLGERKRAEAERSLLVHDLGERVKELTLLHQTASLLQENRPFDEEHLRQLVVLLPPAWQYPEICEGRIRYAGLEARTTGWRDSAWQQTESFTTRDGRTGAIDVEYRESRPAEVEGPFLAEERRLLQSLTHMLATHLDRQLAEQATRQLSARLVTAQEEERRHIARELHDEIGQVLTVVKMNLESLREPTRLAHAKSGVGACVENVDRAIQQVRSLALDLRPAILDDLGLPAALRWFVDRMPEGRLTTHLTVEEGNGKTLSPEMKMAAFRIAQEACTNVLRHARARNIWLTLATGRTALELSVRDDGLGFDLGSLRRSPDASFGLSSMEERARVVGGHVEIRTTPGSGTEVRASFPLGAP